MRAVALVVGLTLLLGFSVALAWGIAGGDTAFRGPYPVLAERAFAIYGLVAILAAGITSAVFGVFGRELSVGGGAGIVFAAWLGEWLVLYLAGWAIANELTGEVSGTFWLLGTGGPIQPLAAFAGFLLGRRLTTRPRLA